MRKRPKRDSIDPCEWYGIGEAAELLGMDRKTLRLKSAMCAIGGGLDFHINPTNGRREFKGETLLRYLNREYLTVG